MKNALWYFDFISPFAYIQNFRLDDFSGHLKIERKPLLFAGLLKHWGTKGPVELTGKRLFTYRYIQWIAEKHGISIRFPKRHPFNPIPLLRLSIAAGCSKKNVDSLFKCVWENGLVGDDPSNWGNFCDAVELSVSEANELISSTEIKSELKLNGESAIAKGVFGVPTLSVDGNLFWGNDSTSMALDFLNNPQFFNSTSMKMLEQLTGYEKKINNKINK